MATRKASKTSRSKSVKKTTRSGKKVNKKKPVARKKNYKFESKKPDYLTQKQFVCLELFIQYGDKKKAAIEAGYAPKTAAVSGARLINGEKGRLYLEERFKEKNDKLIADGDEVMRFLTSVMRGEVKDQFGLDAPLSERTRAANEIAKRTIDNQVESRGKVEVIVDIPKEVPEKVLAIEEQIKEERINKEREIKEIKDKDYQENDIYKVE